MPSKEETPQGDKYQTLESHVHGFCLYTTTHGFARLASARGISWTIFWIVILVGAHSAFYYHTCAIIQEYLERPIRTKVTMKHGKNLEFPTVTICNRNMLRKSKVPLDLLNRTSKILYETKRTINRENITRRASNRKALPSAERKHPEQEEWEKLRLLFSEYSESEMQEYGHQLKDMVLDCMFNGEECTSVQHDETFTWRHIWLDEVGNCYMFNRALDDDGKNIDPYKSSMPGDLSGLKLLLNIEQYEYLDGVSPYAGLRVVIGEQGQMPFPQSSGIDITPGLSTRVELRKNHISRLDPFSNTSCEKTGKLKSDSIFQHFNMTYSKMACKMSCLHAMKTQRCQCSMLHSNDFKFCDFENTTVTECLSDVFDKFIDGDCEKGCPPPCSEVYYSTTLSSSKWPSNNYVKKLNESLTTNFKLPMTKDEISDNLMELHIYFAELDYVVVEETLKYEVQDIMSNVGGQLGMWIGVSAVSIAEVIELIIIVVNFLINKKKVKRTVNAQRINVS